jgi:putative DNA primase/helicase
VTGEPRGLWRRPSIQFANACDLKRSLASATFAEQFKPMTLGPMGGCVIRLWPQEQVGKRLVIAEGIETALAAATRVSHRGKLLRPVWATGCANNMRRFPVLDGIEQLIILADNDASGTGQAAAAECAQRWSDAGREVVRLKNNKMNSDFNDLVRP